MSNPPFEHNPRPVGLSYLEARELAASSGLRPRRFSYASAASGPASISTPTYLADPRRTSVISHLLNASDDSSYHQPSHTARTGGPTHQFDLNGNSMAGGATGSSWSRDAHLPSFSKAFSMFTAPPGTPDGLGPDGYPGFFVPSYLKGSAFMQHLEDAYRAKMQAKKDMQSSAQGQGSSGSLSTSASSVSLHAKPPSHRGMAYDVVEKPPPFDEDDSVSPLPTRWAKDDKHQVLDVLGDGLEIKYNGPRDQSEKEHEAYSIRADNFMPPQCGIYYFEVKILSGRKDETMIGIGFSGKSVALSRPPGWEPDSYGYHGDDGNCYAAHSGGKQYGPSFTSHDVIGCGVNFRTGSAFFTKNGVLLGTAFKDIKGKFYPSVGLKKPGEHILVNFGRTPFTFDIDGMMELEKERIQTEIAATNPTALVPNSGMKETELIQGLVLQFLQHDGYVETARAFAEEIHEEKKALTIDPKAVVEDINVRDDENATKRQHIRRAVLEGNIEKAFKYTDMYYPDVLKDNGQVYFRLRCRRFIEMVRTAAEMRTASEGKKSNGHVHIPFEPHDSEMDLDLNGVENNSFDRMEEDGVESAIGLEELEAATLQYGQQLQAEFSTDPRKEVTKALGDIYSLLAYQNPLKEKDVAHLLDKKGRVAVAEELNSAILLSLGKSSRSALERVYAQTSVLLEMLRENGGPGAFVSLQELIDSIPKSHDP